MTKRYSVVEIFRTLQGEGFHAGTPALFVRFAGCNLWSGHELDRDRDATRSRASCPRWCDTDFRKGQPLERGDIVKELARLSGENAPIDHFVFTGGEPLLQLDVELVDAIHRELGGTIAVETNGTVLPDEALRRAVWVTCSPKRHPDEIRFDVNWPADEVKVIWPDYDPERYAKVSHRRFVQPVAKTTGVGMSVVDLVAMESAARWVSEHPSWRLSLQTHKLLGLR